MKRIKELRVENELSLRELASQLNISYSSLGKYERGEQEPSFDTLKKISTFFNVTTDYLLGFSDVKNPEYAEINNEIGLTDKSIEIIKKKKKDISYGLNAFVQNPLFLELMESYSEYVILAEIPQEELEDIVQVSYGYDSFNLNDPMDLASRNLLDRLERLPSVEAYKMYIFNIFTKILNSTQSPTD